MCLEFPAAWSHLGKSSRAGLLHLGSVDVVISGGDTGKAEPARDDRTGVTIPGFGIKESDHSFRCSVSSSVKWGTIAHLRRAGWYAWKCVHVVI